MNRYFDKTGKQISLLEYGELSKDPKYHYIAKTILKKYIVSTIWFGYHLGTDQSIETIVFFNEDGELGDPDYEFEAIWSRNEDEAKAVHEMVVNEYRARENG